MAVLAKIKTEKVDVKQLILGSIVLTKRQKDNFLELLPSLSKEQLQKLAQFFLDEKKEIENITNKYKGEKSKVYLWYLTKLNKAIVDEKKEIRKTDEIKSNSIDEEYEEKLLQSMDNL